MPVCSLSHSNTLLQGLPRTSKCTVLPFQSSLAEFGECIGIPTLEFELPPLLPDLSMTLLATTSPFSSGPNRDPLVSRPRARCSWAAKISILPRYFGLGLRR